MPSIRTRAIRTAAVLVVIMITVIVVIVSGQAKRAKVMVARMSTGTTATATAGNFVDHTVQRMMDGQSVRTEPPECPLIRFEQRHLAVGSVICLLLLLLLVVVVQVAVDLGPHVWRCGMQRYAAGQRGQDLSAAAAASVRAVRRSIRATIIVIAITMITCGVWRR